MSGTPFAISPILLSFCFTLMFGALRTLEPVPALRGARGARGGRAGAGAGAGAGAACSPKILSS